MAKHYTVYVIKRIVEHWDYSSTTLETGHLTQEAAEREKIRLEAHEASAKKRMDAPSIEYVIEAIEVYP